MLMSDGTKMNIYGPGSTALTNSDQKIRQPVLFLPSGLTLKVEILYCWVGSLCFIRRV